MKNLKNKINFLFCFSVIFFIVASCLHFLIIKKEKEAQAAGVLSIAGVVGAPIIPSCVLIPPAPPTCDLCVPNLELQQVPITQKFGGDMLATPILCIPSTGLPLLNGIPLSTGVTFMGGFTSTGEFTPVGLTGVVQAGMAGSY